MHTKVILSNYIAKRSLCVIRYTFKYYSAKSKPLKILFEHASIVEVSQNQQKQHKIGRNLKGAFFRTNHFWIALYSIFTKCPEEGLNLIGIVIKANVWQVCLAMVLRLLKLISNSDYLKNTFLTSQQNRTNHILQLLGNF